VKYEESTGIMFTKWKDKKDVHLLSTCIADGTIEVTRAGKAKNIPLVVNCYNNNMGGVDRSDQMMTLYEVERKRVKKWYKKYFMHLINTCIMNSHIIYSKIGKGCTALKFREELIRQIFSRYTELSPLRPRTGRPSLEDPLRLVERHFPTIIPPDPNSKSKKPNKRSWRCHVCSINKIRSESKYYCKECNVGLCVYPCFMYYHTSRDLTTVLSLLYRAFNSKQLLRIKYTLCCFFLH